MAVLAVAIMLLMILDLNDLALALIVVYLGVTLHDMTFNGFDSQVGAGASQLWRDLKQLFSSLTR